jgi:hypothetical protein
MPHHMIRLCDPHGLPSAGDAQLNRLGKELLPRIDRLFEGITVGGPVMS